MGVFFFFFFKESMLRNKIHWKKVIYVVIFRDISVDDLLSKNNSLKVLLTQMTTNVTLRSHIILELPPVHNRKKKKHVSFDSCLDRCQSKTPPKRFNMM